MVNYYSARAKVDTFPDFSLLDAREEHEGAEVQNSFG